MVRTRGDPHINLSLAVLRTAKVGNSKMWRDYKKENKLGINQNPFEVAF